MPILIHHFYTIKGKYHLSISVRLQKWFYQDSVNKLRNIFDRLELILDGAPWIRFKDDVFFALCLPLWDADGDGGITQEEADIAIKLDSSNSPFSYNDNIIDATDFKYLNWIPYGYGQVQLFRECTNLKRVAFRNGTLLGSGVFMNCTSLEYVELPENVSNPDSYYGNVFQGCISLKTVNLPQNKSVYGISFFQESGLEVLEFPDIVTTIGGYICFKCTSLREVRIGKNIISIGNQCWNGCSSMVGFYIRAVNPPTLADQNSFANTTFPIYVPRGSVSAYKTAANWSVWADRIYEYDF